jgi:hypothetical protein
MYQVTNSGMITEEELEVKLCPVGNVVIAQISSGTIRGTLSIQTDIYEEELTELGKVIFNLMQELDLHANEDAVDSSNGRGN